LPIKKRKEKIRNYPLDETIVEFLLTGEKPVEGTPAWSFYLSRHFDDSRDLIRKTWEQNREFLLTIWKH
jgi:hypothetical protein